MKLLRLFATTACSFLCATSSQALLIDTFTTPQYATAPSFVSGPGILGGERDISLTGGGKSFTAGGGTGTFAGDDTAGIGVTSISWDGVDGGTGIVWGLPDTDLTDGGLSDRFILDVVSVSGSLTLIMGTGQSFSDRSLSPQITISSPGQVEILFSAFAPYMGGRGADFQAVNGIHWGFLTSDPGVQESITFGAFRTGGPVPEPTSAILVGLGLGLMGARRGRGALA